MRIGTYNLKDYWRDPDQPGETNRYRLVEEVIANDLQPDILAVQELVGDTCGEALQRLGAATGLTGDLGGRLAATPGAHSNLGFGFLWRPDTARPLPETFSVFRDGLWHVLIALSFEYNGGVITLFNYHAPPRLGRAHEVVNTQRVAEAHQVVAWMAPRETAFLMGDFNSLWGDVLYDPIPQGMGTDELQEASFSLNREPAGVFYAAGLRDVAVTLGAPWEPTTGHWPNPSERNGYRRIDRLLHKPAAERLLRGYGVVRTRRAFAASDHCPAYCNLASNATP